MTRLRIWLLVAAGVLFAWPARALPTAQQRVSAAMTLPLRAWVGPSQIPTPSGSGTVLTWSGTALSWAAASGVGLGTAGQALFTNAGATATAWGSFSGDISCSTGTPGSCTVVSIFGTSPISISPATLQFTAATSGPTITQTTATSDVATQSIMIAPQGAFASATGSHQAGGNLILAIPGNVNGYVTTNGLVEGSYAGTVNWALGGNPGGPTGNAELWLQQSSPSNTNWVMLSDGTSVILNAPSAGSGILRFRTGNNENGIILNPNASNTEFFPPTIEWANTTSAPALTQLADAPTSSASGSAGQSLTVTAKAGQAATGASHNGGAGGDLVLGGGLGGTSGSAAAGVGGAVKLSGARKVTFTTAITATTYAVDTQSTTGDYVVFTDSTSNVVAVTLPAPSAGRCLWVKDKTGKAATHNVTVAQHAAETIDGATSVVMTKNFDSLELCTDGTNWSVMTEFSSSIVP